MLLDLSTPRILNLETLPRFLIRKSHSTDFSLPKFCDVVPETAMEVLLVAALAAAGYELSKRAEARETARERRDARELAAQLPIDDLADFVPGGLAYEVQRAHFEAAGNPRETGAFDPISGPNLVPLPRGRAPLYANDPQENRFPLPKPRAPREASRESARLAAFGGSGGWETEVRAHAKARREAFSGYAIDDGDDRARAPSSDTGTWMHKVESGPRFDPAESAVRVRSTGSGGNPDYNRRAPVVSGTQNNVRPTTAVSVGSGVGYGPDVPAADGFHPYFRALPNNVGVYKKNNLVGGFVPGKNAVDVRTSQFYIVDQYKPPKFYSLSRRPLGPNMAAVTAPREREEEPREVCKGHDLSEQYFGNPNMVQNVPGAYTGADNADPTRQSVGNERVLRQSASAIGPGAHPLGPGMGKEEFRVDEGRFEKLHSYETDRIGAGPLKTHVDSGFAENYPQPQATLRQRVDERPYGHFLGIAAPTGHFIQQGPENQNAPKNLERHAKRGDQLVTDFVPIGKFKTNDELTFGDVGIKGKEIGGRIMGSPQVGAASSMLVTPGALGRNEHSTMNVKLIGVVSDQKSKSARADQTNPWIGDLDLAANQLSRNDLAKTWTKKVSGAERAPT
jgi:hypothetical protein